MRSKVVIPAVLLLLAGCASREHLRADFGASQAINRTAQVVDPQAESRAPRPQVGDGQKMEQALKDYRKGKPEASRDHLIISTKGGK
jgi:type IV pilus biogenesis protein CpaD/CtpE